MRRLATRLVYENRWLRLREDEVEHPNGARGIYSVVEKPDFVVVLAVEDGHVHLVEQLRYPIGARFWELPQGAWEDRPDAPPQELAAGELAEETGLRARTWTPLGEMFNAYGYSTQRLHVFAATDLVQGPAAPDPEEQGLRVERVPLARFEAMLTDGTIRDGATLAAYALLVLRLRALPPTDPLHAHLRPDGDGPARP